MSEFNWDQPHPLFAKRQKAVEIAKLKLDIAEAELSAVCFHKMDGRMMSYFECTICGASERTAREEYEKLAASMRARLASLDVHDPLIRGGKDDL